MPIIEFLVLQLSWRLEDRQLNQARSKPDTVNRPVRTAHIFVHHCNSTQYCSIETVFYLYSPSSRPTSHLNVANWREGETKFFLVYTRNYQTVKVVQYHKVSSLWLATLSLKCLALYNRPLNDWQNLLRGTCELKNIGCTKVHTKTARFTQK